MTLCVYCGSSFGRIDLYRDHATLLGRLLAERGIDIVYGGARVGLMGALADAALAAGGKVTGVIPRSLIDRELAHAGLHQLHIVETMHERKAMMADLSDGFIVLPGGAGTLEEFFEVWTWGQLGIHAKPVGLYNVAGYYDGLIDFVRQMVREGFLWSAYVDSLIVSDGVDDLLDQFQRYSPPPPKWTTSGPEIVA